MGQDPTGHDAQRNESPSMNFLILAVLLLLFFGGCGFYLGGPWLGGSGIGLIFVIILGFLFVGSLRGK
jgi:hypothetical protein